MLHTHIFFTEYKDPAIFFELVYVIIPWLVVSILASVFLDKFGNVQFRNALGNKLGLGTLGYEENGKEFLWACKNGQAALVKTMLGLWDNSVLNKKDADDSDKSGLHISCDNEKVEVVKVLIGHSAINLKVKDKDGKTALYYGMTDERIALSLLR